MFVAMKLNPNPEDPGEIAHLADLCGRTEAFIQLEAEIGSYLIMDDPSTKHRQGWMIVTSDYFHKRFKFVDKETDDFEPIVHR